MTLEVLICHPDGTQTVELKEFPADWFVPHDSTENEK